jgi:hypothetical protein
LELYESVDPQGAAAATNSLDQLGALLEAVDALGPVSQRAIRSFIQRRMRQKR